MHEKLCLRHRVVAKEEDQTFQRYTGANAAYTAKFFSYSLSLLDREIRLNQTPPKLNESGRHWKKERREFNT